MIRATRIYHIPAIVEKKSGLFTSTWIKKSGQMYYKLLTRERLVKVQETEDPEANLPLCAVSNFLLIHTEIAAEGSSKTEKGSPCAERQIFFLYTLN